MPVCTVQYKKSLIRKKKKRKSIVIALNGPEIAASPVLIPSDLLCTVRNIRAKQEEE